MAEVFGNQNNIRGCFAVFRLDSSTSRGAILRMPAGGDLPNTYSDPLLVIGFSASQAEGVSYTKVFGGRVYTYAFGHDPNASRLNVDMMGFLINGYGYSDVVETVNQSYNVSRVSISGQYAKLGLGTGGSSTPLRGFVVGISTNTADPQHSLQRFTVHLALVEAQA